MSEDPAQEQEWIRQNNLAYVGLIGVGVLHGAAIPHGRVALRVRENLRRRLRGGDPASRRSCIGERAGSLPATLSEFRRGHGREPVAERAVFIGLVSGSWHIAWFAGVTMLVAAPIAVAVHSVGYSRLERLSRRGSRK